ncbi:MAG: YafY family transcriptional regulator [Bryobacteraceae bacterium]|nr:YafY family transcriptional regulator [Bryobacteraceae bacterium]
MLETSARLLRLLSLFQIRRYWSGADLADRLEITVRTLRRDVDKLRTLGYPIRSASGVEGGYQLGAGASMPPLLLDDEETVAVALGLRSAAAGNIRGVEEASLRALAKIEQILPPRLGRRIAAMQTMIVTPPGAGSAVDARILSTIAGACRDNEALRFRYKDHAGAPTTRHVEPYRLVTSGHRWYLVAWDSDRRAWRTFRVDRIQSRPTAGARFPPREPPAADLASYVFRGAWSASPCRARIKLLAAAETLAERLPSWIGLVQPVDERSCILETGAPTYESLAMHLSLLGVDFEVTEPAELIEELRRLADRYRRAAPSGTL